MTRRARGGGGVVALLVLSLVACSSVVPPSPSPGSGPGSAGNLPTPTSTLPGDGASPADVGSSRASLIAQAVADGRVDPVTGLLYRAYGLFGLPGLPDEFAAGVPRADDGLFAQMAALMPTLSADDQAKLQPFLARPTEPNSIFGVAPTAIVGQAARVAANHPTAQCANWTHSGDADTRFKVWACRDQDAAAADSDVAALSAMITDIWGPMTRAAPDGMGSPLPDGHGPSCLERVRR